MLTADTRIHALLRSPPKAEKKLCGSHPADSGGSGWEEVSSWKWSAHKISRIYRQGWLMLFLDFVFLINEGILFFEISLIKILYCYRDKTDSGGMVENSRWTVKQQRWKKVVGSIRFYKRHKYHKSASSLFNSTAVILPFEIALYIYFFKS